MTATSKQQQQAQNDFNDLFRKDHIFITYSAGSQHPVVYPATAASKPGYPAISVPGLKTGKNNLTGKHNFGN